MLSAKSKLDREDIGRHTADKVMGAWLESKNPARVALLCRAAAAGTSLQKLPK